MYGFASGDPITFSDPFGLRPCRVRGPWGTAVVDHTVAADFVSAKDRAYREGVRGRVNSSYRSTERQRAIRESDSTAARAGSSAHEAGTAVDQTWKKLSDEHQRETLRAAMNDNNFEQTYGGRHHWEHTSTRTNPEHRANLIRENGSYDGEIRDCFAAPIVITAARR